jgi:DNA-binding GntR family transcriptional regulator
MSVETSIPKQIVALIKSEEWAAGSHLPAQMLADRLRVSRQPVNSALALLHEKGILTRERNRGYFLTRPLIDPLSDIVAGLGLAESDVVTSVYFQIADDLLKNELPLDCSEQLIRTRYGLTAAQTGAVLARIANEGWAERKPGYGWTFSSMLTTPDSLLQSYRLRLALEPAALLEPGYKMDRKVLEQCRATELQLLDGGIATASADELHNRGVRFHESLVEASGNPFFIDTIRRVNRVRRLLSYRSMQRANAIPSTAASTCTCSTCSSASERGSLRIHARAPAHTLDSLAIKTSSSPRETRNLDHASMTPSIRSAFTPPASCAPPSTWAIRSWRTLTRRATGRRLGRPGDEFARLLGARNSNWWCSTPPASRSTVVATDRRTSASSPSTRCAAPYRVHGALCADRRLLPGQGRFAAARQRRSRPRRRTASSSARAAPTTCT